MGFQQPRLVEPASDTYFKACDTSMLRGGTDGTGPIAAVIEQKHRKSTPSTGKGTLCLIFNASGPPPHALMYIMWWTSSQVSR